MKTASFGVKLFLKSGRLKEDGTATIYARIRLDRDNKMELTTNKSIAPEYWHDSGKVVKHPDSKQINKHLEAFKSKINSAYSELFIAKQDISLDAIKAIVLGEPVTPKHTLLSVAQEHDTHFKSMLGIKYSAGSYKNYKTTLKYLIEFVPIHTGKQDISLTGVDYKFCEAFFSYLTTKKDCHTNGANKQLQRLKKIVNYAIKLGYISTNPMATYTLEFEPVNKVALTLSEIERIGRLDIQRVTLRQVRDVFLMQCYTGLSYADLKRLSACHLSRAENGVFWIRMERQKTKVSFAIPLLPQALGLLQIYMPEQPTDNALFPVLSNQKMNENLKVIQELGGISKHLTTHLARHSFATVALSNGVPIETVSRLLGHTKLSTTQIYAKVLESKIEADMANLEAKLNRVIESPSKKQTHD